MFIFAAGVLVGLLVGMAIEWAVDWPAIFGRRPQTATMRVDEKKGDTATSE